MLSLISASKIAGAIVLGALALPVSAQAASFTIYNGENAGQQYLTDPGDVGTVERGGSVYSSGSDASWSAIQSFAPDNTAVNNYGSVEADGLGVFGIYGIGDHFVVNNAGSVSGYGDSITGIYAIGGQYATITNTGSVSEFGTNTVGIFSYGDDATITNRGSITTLDDVNNASEQTIGIVADGDYREHVVNSGTISVTGHAASGVFLWSEDASVTNSGSIVANGAYAYGVFGFTAGNDTIVNSGSIVANGLYYSEGVIDAGTGNTTLINSGRIIATASAGDAYAIDMSGANDTVTLLAHTAIQGGIYFGQPGSATLNIGTGLNTALTFYDSSDLPTTINTSGQPYVIDGALLAVADPTGLAAANSFGFDLTRSINDAVEAHLGAPGTDALTTAALPGPSSAAGRGYWASGLGFYDQYAGQGSLDGYHDGAAGMIAGLDSGLSASTSAGVFGGVSAGVIQTTAASTNINAVGAFAGGYWNHDDGKAFARVSFAGGGLDNNSDRTVANNLVDGGLETASAEYGSFYVSPALTLGLHHGVGGAIVSPSIGVRYAGLYRGGYSESGSAANVTAGSSTAQAFDVRGELRTDFAAKVSAAGVLRYNARAGVDGIFTSGGATSGELLGTDITLLAGNQTSVARGYLGGGLTFSQANGTRINTDVQASYDTANTFALSAQAGLSGAF